MPLSAAGIGSGGSDGQQEDHMVKIAIIALYALAAVFAASFGTGAAEDRPSVRDSAAILLGVTFMIASALVVAA